VLGTSWWSAVVGSILMALVPIAYWRFLRHRPVRLIEQMSGKPLRRAYYYWEVSLTVLWYVVCVILLIQGIVAALRGR